MTDGARSEALEVEAEPAFQDAHALFRTCEVDIDRRTGVDVGVVAALPRSIALLLRLQISSCASSPIDIQPNPSLASCTRFVQILPEQVFTGRQRFSARRRLAAQSMTDITVSARARRRKYLQQIDKFMSALLRILTPKFGIFNSDSGEISTNHAYIVQAHDLVQLTQLRIKLRI